MPFGYTKYLEDQGKSEETIKGYNKTIKMFFEHLDQGNEKAKEIYEINPGDIKNFLKYKINQGNELNTVNKHLTVLKSFFDYLWKIGKAPIDPAVKIKKYKANEQKPNLINYSMLQEIYPFVIKNPFYSNLRKCIFILALYGVRSMDYQILKDNVKDRGTSVDIFLDKRKITLSGIESDIFIKHFFESHFNDSNYVFITKKHDGTIVPVEHMSIHTHLNAIRDDYSLPVNLTLNSIRHAYAYYLYVEENLPVEEISDILGIETNSAANLVKVSLEKHMLGKEVLENKNNSIVE